MFNLDVRSVILVSGVLSLVMAVLLYFGSQRFYNLTPSVRPWSALVLLAMLPIAWFSLMAPHYGVRVAIVGGLMSLLALVDAVLNRDTALYAAKAAGRNCVRAAG